MHFEKVIRFRPRLVSALASIQVHQLREARISRLSEVILWSFIRKLSDALNLAAFDCDPSSYGWSFFVPEVLGRPTHPPEAELS
jgi:hypothetical protein